MFENAHKGFSDISSAASKVNFNPLNAGIQGVGQQFSAMSAIAFSVLNNITTKAMDAGAKIAKSLTIAPISAGLQEYETNLNSVQTIMANTQSKGSTLKDVNGALKELNNYSDQTIYNFSEMAKNIGTFTAAGIDLKTSTGSIKGIANLAAMSGSNSQQASTAMYQLSQAMSAGTVKLQDWNSVVNAGMGGEVFQNSLKETARVHGVNVDKLIKKEGSFRESLSTGWITSEIMTETLAKFTGDLSEKQLQSMGYNAKQIKGIMAQAQTAKDAATKVKTLSQLMGTLEETVQSGWAQTFEHIFGDFEEAKELWSGINEVVGGALSRQADARNQMLAGWKDMGGRTELIAGLKNTFNGLMSVVKPITEAFRNIFPATTSKQLYDMTKKFSEFTEKLKLSDKSALNLKRTFQGVFSLFRIGWEIVKGIVDIFMKLFGAIFSGTGAVLGFTAKLGDMANNLAWSLTKGDGLANFFDKLGDKLIAPIKAIKDFGSSVKDSLGTDPGTELEDGIGRVATRTEGVRVHLEAFAAGVGDAFDKVQQKLGPIVDKIGDFLGSVGTKLKETFSGEGAFDRGIDVANVGIFAAIAYFVKKFLDGGLINVDFFKDFIGSLQEMFGALTDTLGAMQSQLKASALMKIAMAIGILAASIVVLSMIDSDKLQKALLAITGMFLQLGLGMLILTKISPDADAKRMGKLAAGLILLATAILILSHAVQNLAALDWQGLARGLTGLVGILLALALTLKLMPETKGLVRTGLGLIVLAGAIRLLGESVELFSKLDWAGMGRGLAGVAALLVSLALFTKFSDAGKMSLRNGLSILAMAGAMAILAQSVQMFSEMGVKELAKGLGGVAVALVSMSLSLKLMPKNLMGMSVGILMVSGAMFVMAEAIKKFAGMEINSIGQGLISISAALVVIGVALRTMPKKLGKQSKALMGVAVAIVALSQALMMMGGLTPEQVAVGLIALGGSLGILAGGVRLMGGAAKGAIGMMLVTAALGMLIPLLLHFAAAGIATVALAIGGIAAALTVLGLAGLLIGPVVPALLLLGGAIAAIGAGAMLAGAAIMLMAAGMGALAELGSAGVEAMKQFSLILVDFIKGTVVGLGEAFIEIIRIIGESAPVIGEAAISVIKAVLDAFVTVIPDIVNAVLTLIDDLLRAFADHVPSFVQSGMDIIVGTLTGIAARMPEIMQSGMTIIISILQGIANNIQSVVEAGADIIISVLKGIAKKLPDMITAGVDVIVAFLDGVADNIDRIIDAGFNLVIEFIRGLTNAIDERGGELMDAGWDLAESLIKGAINGITEGVSRVKDAAVNMAKSAWNGAKEWLGINSPSKKFEWIGMGIDEGMTQGIDKYSRMVYKSTESVGKGTVETMRRSLAGLEELVNMDMNLSPTISPVVDLTSFRAGIGQMNSEIANSRIAPSQSFAKANSIRLPETGSDYYAKFEPAPSNVINYTQYNTSPKALSSAEIYRNTRASLRSTQGRWLVNAY
jgi:tape measure domain-containing protein